ncbi:hypothetical protein [Glycomyces algeriensis]|uniref:Uncharacterized protein n=1 Tax=Glycomyces algeriensis TaxID=256037 RepID=A0A9W6GBK1_9ACTN|nr:hypothetical protein [Glycomyces algeriensis]MDA1366643.1 hypothetical protein [Glycomyces algeriensis]MDR7352300.1 hypothetical protein [Glycomyces algeriensis]GLI45035.1 hypothetical protein GALLR39Z86_48850 [Glycomyces algeriensis]
MSTSDPQALYDKPHSVDLAQVMLVFQYFMVLSVSVGIGPRIFNWVKGETEGVPFLADVEAAIDIGASFPIAVVAPALVVYTVPYVMAVLALGLGRKWARVAAVVFVPLNTWIGITAVVRTYGEVWALIVSPLWIIVSLCVLGGLASHTARQWFRQGGWEPWYLRYEIDQIQRARGRVRPRPRRRRRYRTAHDPNQPDAD